MAPTLGVVAQRDLDETAAAHERMPDAALAGDLDEYPEAVLAPLRADPEGAVGEPGARSLTKEVRWWPWRPHPYP